MSKTIRDIPDQAAVLLDANIVIYALSPQSQFHRVCAELLQRGARRALALHLSVSTAAEVIHRVMLLEVMAQGRFQHGLDAVTHLKHHPDAVQQLTRYKAVLRDLSQARITLLALTYKDLHASRRYRETYGLLTSDSLLVAAMQRERIPYLATNDSDFERIPNIAVRMPG